MNAFLLRKLPILFLLFLSWEGLLATPACPIITQSFQNSANGATIDNSATGWYVDSSKLSHPVYFAVMSNRFKAENIGAEGVWYSRVFSVAGYASFQAAVKITAEGLQTSAEYVKIYYKIDGGAETLLDQRTGNFGTIDFTSGVLTGNNIQLIVRIYDYNNGSGQTSKYYIEQYRVFKEAAPCAIGSIGVSDSASHGGVLTCTNPSLTLYGYTTASGTTTYSWTGPNSFTSAAQNPSVTSAGTYTVVATNAAGSGSASITVTSNQATPDLTATGGALACASSVTINASSSVSGATYRWTGPNSFTSTSRSPSVSAAGTYTVTVTNPANGCTASQSVTVSSGTATSSTLWLEDFTLANGTTVDNGTTSWSISNPGTGTFSVQNNEFKASFVSANEGVWSSGVVNIAGKTNVIISADLRSNVDAGKALENDDYIHLYYKLNGGPETAFYLDSAGIGSSTTGTASATVSSASLSGNTLQIIIRVKNSDTTEHYYFDNVKIVGASSSVTVTPSVTGAVTCTGTAQLSATVSGGTATAWSWTGPNGFTSAVQNPTISAGGQYTVTATIAGCTISAPITVSENKTAPDISATGGTLACLTAVTLNVSSSVAGAVYSWTGPNSFTSSSQSPSVSAAGSYTAKVVNPANGCSATQSVTVSAAASSTLWLEDFTLANGTTVDNGTTSWSISNPGTGTFSVQNNEFKASFVSANEGVWSSGVVNIAGKTNVVISADLRSNVDAGKALENDDYIHLYYKLNGGPETAFYLDSAGIGSSTTGTASATVSSASLSGNTLQIIIRAKNSDTTEHYYFDNVKIVGTGQAAVTATATGSVTCTGSAQLSATVSGGTATAWSWTGPNSFTSNSQNPLVTAGGQYTVTATLSGGCSASSSVTVTEDKTAPDIAATGGTLKCLPTVAINVNSSVANAAYSWIGPNSFSSAVQTPAVSAAGGYTATVTNPANGCTASQMVQVNTQATGNLWLEDFTLANGTVTDNGATAWSATTNPSTSIFSVQNNEYRASAMGATGEGVWSSAVLPIAGKTNVTISALERCAFTGTSGGMNASGSLMDYLRFYYRLDNGPEVLFNEKLGAINNYSTVNTAISFSGLSGTSLQIVVRARATGTDEFYYFDSVKVSSTGTDTLNVTASAPTKLTCSNGSVTLSGVATPSTVTYSWTGPNSFSSAAQNPSVTAAGIYTLTVTNPATGCTASDTALVIQANTGLVTTASSNSLLTCRDTIATLTGSSSGSRLRYSWTGPNSFVSALQNPTTKTAGIYTLTVTDSSTGCTGSDTANIAQNKTLPVVIASAAGQLACNNSITSLNGTYTPASGVTINWAGPNGFVSATQNPSVTSAGIYTLTVTNTATGCIGSDTAMIIFNNTPPGASAAVSGTLNCRDTVVTLSGSSPTAGAPFAWSGPGGFSSGVQNPTVKQGGTYTLVVTSPVNGCTSSATVTVNQDTARAANTTAAITSAVTKLTCTNNNVFLQGSTPPAGFTYGWSGPNGFSYPAYATPVYSPGIYTYTVTNPSNFCSASASVNVVQDMAPPAGFTVAPVISQLTCTQTTVTEVAGSSTPGVSYAWNGPNSFSASGNTVAINAPGNYNVTLTNPVNGCTLSSAVTVLQNIAPPANLVASTLSGSAQLTCSNASQVLSAGSSTGNVSFAWSGPNGFSAATATAAANTAGTYNLVATNNANGCTASKAVVLQLNTTPPAGVTATAASPAIINCTTVSIALTGTSATPGVRYNWTGPAGFTANTPNSSATAAGTYTLTVTDTTNGCTASSSTSVAINVVSPEGVTANGSNQITCDLPQVNLVGSSTIPNAVYTWTGPNGFAATGAVVPTTRGGVYTLKVTNPDNGCFKTLLATVSQNTAPPAGVTATNSGPLTCDVTSVTLTGNSTSPNVEYEWNGPDGYLSFSAQDVATEGGDYILTVTNDDNGCTLNDTTNVQNICGPSRRATVKTGVADTIATAIGNAFEFKAYPNPFNKQAFVAFKSPRSAFVTVQLFNSNGMLEKTLYNDKAAAGQLYQLPFTGWFVPGVHYVVVRVDNTIYTKQLVSVQ